jgi:hypothetical protein
MTTAAEVGTSANLILFIGRNRQFAADLIKIVNDLRGYWPLTVRQAYYRAVAALLIPNAQNEYRRVSRILTDLRRNDLLPWHAIEDRTRRTIDKRGVPDLQTWAAEQMESFMDPRYYGRCYVQHQRVYVEVATEKDALASIVEEAVWMFCTRLNIVRGQVSATLVNAMAERFEKAAYRGRRPVLLYLGDLDPSGVAIPKALVRNMANHHGVEVELVRVGLNPDQVKMHCLPEDPEAAKTQDPNYSAWLAEYGDQAPVELDALHPATLTQIVQSALSATYDMSQVEAQKAREAEDREVIKVIRRRVEDVVFGEFPEVFRRC